MNNAPQGVIHFGAFYIVIQHITWFSLSKHSPDVAIYTTNSSSPIYIECVDEAARVMFVEHLLTVLGGQK